MFCKRRVINIPLGKYVRKNRVTQFAPGKHDLYVVQIVFIKDLCCSKDLDHEVGTWAVWCSARHTWRAKSSDLPVARQGGNLKNLVVALFSRKKAPTRIWCCFCAVQSAVWGLPDYICDTFISVVWQVMALLSSFLWWADQSHKNEKTRGPPIPCYTSRESTLTP